MHYKTKLVSDIKYTTVYDVFFKPLLQTLILVSGVSTVLTKCLMVSILADFQSLSF